MNTLSPEPVASPAFDYLRSMPGVRKIGLLYGNSLYEVAFNDEGAPLAGAITVNMLKVKMEAAVHLDGILLVVRDGHLRRVRLDEADHRHWRVPRHLQGMKARDGRWVGLTPPEIRDAFERDRRLKIITRLEECFRIDTCALEPHVSDVENSEPPGHRVDFPIPACGFATSQASCP